MCSNFSEISIKMAFVCLPVCHFLSDEVALATATESLYVSDGSSRQGDTRKSVTIPNHAKLIKSPLSSILYMYLPKYLLEREREREFVIMNHIFHHNGKHVGEFLCSLQIF